MPPSEPSAWSTTASSIAQSAEEQMRVDLLAKQRLLLLAQKNAAEFKRRLAEATARLEQQESINRSHSAKAKSKIIGSKRKSTAAAEPHEDVATEPDNSPSPPKRSKRAGPFKDVMAVGLSHHEHEPDSSEEEAPAPDGDSQDDDDCAAAKDEAYKGLHSILCAYKDKSNKEVDPRDESNEITFEVCAELCEEETAETAKWSQSEIVNRHPMIISALKLVYKDKNRKWFEQAFLKSPKGAQKYWIKVLKRRAVIWRESHKKIKLLKAKPVADRKSLSQKLREKISQKKKERTGVSSKSKSSTQPTIHVISDSSNSSAEEASVVKPEPECAPAPESYSASEVKTFAKMAKAIRNCDEVNGLSSAVADFVDSEFSDNTCVYTTRNAYNTRRLIPTQHNRGEMARAHKAPYGSWRHNQFRSACNKAAKIMEVRSVWTTISIPRQHHIHPAQGETFQTRRRHRRRDNEEKTSA